MLMALNNVYQNIVLKLLEKMQHGKLRLSIKNGAEYSFGQGDGTSTDIRVNDVNFFKRIVLYGDIGFGESYMLNEWETSNLTNVISFLLGNMKYIPTLSGARKTFSPVNLLKLINRIQHVLNPNSLKGAKQNISKHYDLSNEFFSQFLDRTMTYSCALFKDPDDTLEDAQIRKYDSLCKSTKLSKDDHVLEIGCGWGGFAIHAAKNYGCKVTGITISKKQYDLARERVRAAGLEDKVNIVFEDYRKVKGEFDKVISIEMIEAVGHRYFKTYFDKINKILKPNGVLGLQAIIIPDSRYSEYRKSVDWLQKHIFPGGLLPSIAKINESLNASGNLNLYSLKEMGLSYARTLKNWYDNFQSNLGTVRALGFDDVFIRKWEYYLCSCEASFLQRNINVVQMVYARPNNPGF